MKNYAKVGNRKGKPAYRTPSSFIAKRAREMKNEVFHFRASAGKKGFNTLSVRGGLRKKRAKGVLPRG